MWSVTLEYRPINGDDLRKSILWICEQMETPSTFPFCAACGHGFQHHHDDDRDLLSCTFPAGLGAPKALCACLNWVPEDEDADNAL